MEVLLEFFLSWTWWLHLDHLHLLWLALLMTTTATHDDLSSTPHGLPAFVTAEREEREEKDSSFWLGGGEGWVSGWVGKREGG